MKDSYRNLKLAEGIFSVVYLMTCLADRVHEDLEFNLSLLANVVFAVQVATVAAILVYLPSFLASLFRSRSDRQAVRVMVGVFGILIVFSSTTDFFNHMRNSIVRFLERKLGTLLLIGAQPNHSVERTAYGIRSPLR